MPQAGYTSAKKMKNQLDTKQFRSLRSVYSATQLAKDSSITKVVTCCGTDTDRLHLNTYADRTLRSAVKIAPQVSIGEADRLLGLISLRRLRLNKRGSTLLRVITTSDWEELVTALASDECKAQISQISMLTDEEQLRFGITELLSIFTQRVLALASKYNRRCLRENHLSSAGQSNFDQIKEHSAINQVAKRVCVESGATE